MVNGMNMVGIMASALFVGAMGASAATVTVIDFSTQGAGNQAHVFAAGYGANTPDGAIWGTNTPADDPTVTPPPANISGVAQSPFNNTAIAGTQNYFSVGAVSGDNGTLSPATLAFGTNQNAFKLLWGSIDSYNTLTFLLDGNAIAGASWTGTDIVNLFSMSQNAPNFEEVALLSFSDFGQRGFNSVKFESSQAAFEFALAPVPLPAGGLLLLGALGGLGALRRRRKAA